MLAQLLILTTEVGGPATQVHASTSETPWRFPRFPQHPLCLHPRPHLPRVLPLGHRGSPFCLRPLLPVWVESPPCRENSLVPDETKAPSAAPSALGEGAPRASPRTPAGPGQLTSPRPLSLAPCAPAPQPLLKPPGSPARPTGTALFCIAPSARASFPSSFA